MDSNIEIGSEIAEYFKGKSIFLTGATGFVGKVLIEKLLRSCQDLKKIYILIRTKKGNDANKRLNEILSAKVIFYSINQSDRFQFEHFLNRFLIMLKVHSLMFNQS